jgi:hypothetical protein
MSLTHVDPHVSEIVMVWIQSGDLLMVWIQISLIVMILTYSPQPDYPYNQIFRKVSQKKKLNKQALREPLER